MNRAEALTVLGFDYRATPTDVEIKRAYKQLALKFHPDRYSGRPEGERLDAEETFKRISQAYQDLLNPDCVDDPVSLSPYELFKMVFGEEFNIKTSSHEMLQFCSFFGNSYTMGKKCKLSLSTQYEHMPDDVDSQFVSGSALTNIPFDEVDELTQQLEQLINPYTLTLAILGVRGEQLPIGATEAIVNVLTTKLKLNSIQYPNDFFTEEQQERLHRNIEPSNGLRSIVQ